MPFYRWEEIKEERLSEKASRKIITGLNMQACLYRLKPGSEAKPHSHGSEQLVFVIKGGLKFRVGDEERVVSEGEVVYIPPGVEHRAEVLGEETLSLSIFSPIRRDFIEGTDTYLRG